MSDPNSLSLPKLAPPEMRQYYSMQPIAVPVALYTLVATDEAKLEAICARAQEDSLMGEPDAGVYGTRPVELAPQHKFVAEPLLRIFEYHVALASKRTYEPWIFAVVTSRTEETQQVLMVSLNADEDRAEDHGEHVVDSLMIDIADLYLVIADLQVANQSWLDIVEDYEERARGLN